MPSTSATRLFPISSFAAKYILERKQRCLYQPIEPQPPVGYRSIVSSTDCNGHWWFTNMPKKYGVFSTGEFAKYDHLYPKSPFGVIGDTLILQEPFYERYQENESGENERQIAYSADGYRSGWRLVPAKEMPEELCRLRVEIVEIGVRSRQVFRNDDEQPEEHDWRWVVKFILRQARRPSSA